jgi:hypothetical protein
MEVNLKKADIKKINKKLLESLHHYRKMVTFMAADMPIGVLCLPKATEKILTKEGILRVYDLFDRDLSEIKGIGKTRIRDLTSSFDKFLSIN